MYTYTYMYTDEGGQTLNQVPRHAMEHPSKS